MSSAVCEARVVRNHYSILVVEDDEVDQIAIQQSLSLVHGGGFVDTVPTLALALDRLSTVRYDLVTLDNHLPDGDGMSLLHWIRCHGPEVIFVTGSGGEKTAVQAMRDGVLDYIIKDGRGDYLIELNQVVNAYFERLEDPHHIERLPLSQERLEKTLETLREVVPLCYSCKKIRDNTGTWVDAEIYFRDLFNLRFSHGVCPECYVEHRNRD